MMPALLEAEDLFRIPDGERYELIDGIPKKKPLGAQSDEVGGLLLTALNNYIRPKKLGRAYPQATGFQCFPHKPSRVRLPDVTFVAAGRLPGDRSPEGYIQIAPDLAVEVISPNDIYEDVELKILDYRFAGVKLVWIISPKTRSVLIRRLDGSCAELREDGELSGEDVIPGFTCKVADLFV